MKKSNDFHMCVIFRMIFFIIKAFGMLNCTGELSALASFEGQVLQSE